MKIKMNRNGLKFKLSISEFELTKLRLKPDEFVHMVDDLINGNLKQGKVIKDVKKEAKSSTDYRD